LIPQPIPLLLKKLPELLLNLRKRENQNRVSSGYRNNKIYKTEPFDIVIKDIEKKSLHNTSNEVYLNMEIEDRDVYQDQPTIAVLKVYSRNMDNLRKVKIFVFRSRTISMYILSISINQRLILLIWEIWHPRYWLMFMVFPNEAGYVEVPGVSASVNTYSNKNKIVSNKVKLNVKKLPEGAPECFKNAVGNFNVECLLPERKSLRLKNHECCSKSFRRR
jgi:hypothetical protein